MNFTKRSFFTAMSFVLVACALEASDTCPRHLEENQVNSVMYKRIITTSQDRTNIPSNPLDANHELMLTLGYTQEDADALDVEAIADLKAKYNVDFTNVTPNASGIRVIPGVATLLPYAFGGNENISIIQDTKYPERVDSHRWFNIEVGQICLFSGSGVVSGGEYNGATYKAGDIYFFGEINFLKKGANWASSNNREVFKLRCTNLANTVLNQWGDAEYHVKLHAIDKNDNEGFGVAATAVVRRPPADGAEFIEERTTITFDCKRQPDSE